MMKTARLSLLMVAIVILLAATLTPAQQLVQRPRYQLQAGDQVTIHYTFTPEFDQTVTIQSDGFITLTVGGAVPMAGRTLDEATELITKQASVRLNDPVVALTLTEFQKPYYIVAGEVRTPMKYDMREETTAVQAVMSAGGILQTGTNTQVLVFHGFKTGSPVIKVLDMKHFQTNTLLEHDLVLTSGDIVYVSRNKLARVNQYMQIASALGLYLNSAVNIVKY
jgi:polysaccharide export outer membrane protein